MQDVIDADIAELPVAEALSDEKVTTNLGDLCVFFNVFSVPYLYNQPWLLLSSLRLRPVLQPWLRGRWRR